MTLSTKNNVTFEFRAQFEDESERNFITMDDGTELLVLMSYAREETRNGFSLLMVPGWGSIVPGWDLFLKEAQTDFDIIYFETREKASSKIVETKEKCSMDVLSSDLATIIKKLNLNQEKLILFGSCMGANLIANGLAYNKYDPLLSILVGPQPEWPLPKGTRRLVPFAPKWTLTPIRPFLRFWLKHFQSDTPETAAKYIRVVNEASPRKWWWVGKPIAQERYLDIYEKVQKPVIVVAEKGDKMHQSTDAQDMAALMPQSKLIFMSSNKATHSEEMVYKIRELLKIPIYISSEISVLVE